jgi:hypothetical protein
MFFDVFHLAIALIPLAIYMVLLGGIHLRGRPLVTTGGRDVAALALAICGFAVVGPMELFFPEPAAREIGSWVWMLMLTFYSLCATLTILLSKPRVIIYNVSYERLRPVLGAIVPTLDKDARWAGECIVLPNLSMQLHVEFSPVTRNAQLIATGTRQGFEGWKRLESELATALRERNSSRNPFGVSMSIAGVAILGCVVFLLIRDSAEVAQALKDWLRQ